MTTSQPAGPPHLSAQLPETETEKEEKDSQPQTVLIKTSLSKTEALRESVPRPGVTFLDTKEEEEQEVVDIRHHPPQCH